MASTERRAKKKEEGKLPESFGKRSSRHGDGLPPCPFCGKVPDIVENAVGDLRTVSLECACTARDDCYIQFTFDNEASAVMFWRKLDKTTPQDLVQLEEEPLAVSKKQEAEPVKKTQTELWSKRKLAQKLRDFKEKRDLSFSKLEELCGVSNSTLCHIARVRSVSQGKRLTVQRYIEKVEREEVG